MFSQKGKQLLVVFLASFLLVAPYQSATQNEIAASPEESSLSAQLTTILNDEKLEGALAGVSVRSADTGEEMYEYNGDLRLKPASNMKLLTAAAALDTLGEEYTFPTEVLGDGEVKGGKLHGDLYLKGKGDPTLMKEDFEELAKSLKQEGIREVKGDVIADDTWYDDVRLSEDISWNDETNYYAAQVSALTAAPNKDYDAGTVIVAAYPGEDEGDQADIQVTPETEYIQVVNQTETVAADQPKDISITREHGTNNVIIEGTIPVDGTRSRSWVAVSEPSGLALDLFHQALKEEGIKVKGEQKLDGKAPASAEQVTSIESMPLEELLIPFMKLSNNGHAEVLVKEMGKVVSDEGSWEKGLDVVENYLTDIGVDADTMRLRDGSGMSHVNMVPANEISELLYKVRSEEWFDEYLRSLPVAGNSERFVGGTLRYRMGDTVADENVQAKTGSLTGVTSLSGYVTAQNGERLIFSILLNNYLGSVQEIEDEIAITLAEYEG
ncbi:MULTISPECIES: D-alanyl-D-alanine carboxypeptidase/D-alanyl-D-alanine endopeptidase [Pontibacillus]|uniref:D-alanyl-D-alanine carboxypeptidase/D-alanyl-D-alanine-endopeptidase n=1 Tax=Pontibacillus chungwhensis TaxID=265426 RepID=A0ABY8V132_9BACI|nr:MULTISPECIES: D-alanyl-D-alanine carboxypeptidase/D-alanyl-D-alanine-endopeptidase [Pontibacillus]MCD5324503.1 D-alanyl-D-alanine carboxypeptidase/D-alanyl-D-alanine-endopeptidase [Pontibacillus sp. HN14]WIF99203.1 D-alanyl-D-alanine carboxypeptidase/D-alanyl-D-alanine-endopeptidase [Pontibacillus chungwhensis]